MNKSFVVTLLFAAVDAEDGYVCTDSSDTWVDEFIPDITTADDCKAACDTAIEEDTISDEKD